MPLPVARFFAEDFLGAELALDARERTERLYKSLVIAHNQLRQHLEPEENEALGQAIAGTVAAAHINFDDWLEALPLPEERKREIDDVVSPRLPDREFEIDTTVAQKLTRKRRFRGDDDLVVEVSAREFENIIRSVERIEDPGEPPYYRIVIHTEKWDEVPR